MWKANHSTYVGRVGQVRGDVPSLPEHVEAERRQPASQPGFVSDVLVPLSQSILTGVLFASPVALLVNASGWDGDVGRLWLGVASLVALLAWLVLLGQTRSLLWGIERLTRKDIDQDGSVGRPEDVQTVEVVVREGNHVKVVPPGWLGLSDERLSRLASDLVRGRSLAEGDLGQDKALFPRGINQFRDVRSKLVQAGLVALVNESAPNLGYTLTRSGQAVMDRLSSNGNTHTRTHTNGGRVRVGVRDGGGGSNA